MTENAANYRLTEKTFALLKGRLDLAEFMMDVLRLLEEVESYSDPVYWITHGKCAPITFFVLCNDLFYWAFADAEKLLPEDLSDLRQAIDEVRIIGVDMSDMYIGFELWVARKRKLRPQHPAYPNTMSPERNLKLRALFDACGPERRDA